MIGDRDLGIKRESNSTPWLTDAIWGAARSARSRREFLDETTPIEDDHLRVPRGGRAAVDIIDLDYPAWHTADDTLDKRLAPNRCRRSATSCSRRCRRSRPGGSRSSSDQSSRTRSV